jgi:hypothetical protein
MAGYVATDLAPLDHDLELAVIDAGGEHALVFPCRRIVGGWINAATKQRIEVRQTHWRRLTNLLRAVRRAYHNSRKDMLLNGRPGTG